ncbi:TRAP transporter permease [Billgrantia aerodenitrificans]|uniref:TRAP transporter fused permease subunit n=1 Tax=Billgrantia aerodenitrificans TaxID=2733483 RepID=A0ABS9AN19_9GAMM|nr:TRAP transporter fused permease subunit [Halomonas aerodenitrificans]MCE8023218.1 TRAP transporter fused permease subunit [Halomonas aerodenitrificans]
MFKQAIAKLMLSDADAGPRETLVVSLLFSLMAVGVTALVVYGAYFGGITALIFRSLFLSFVAGAGLFYAGLRTQALPVKLALYTLALVSLVPGPYLWHSYMDIIMRGAMSTVLDEYIFIGLLIAVVVLVRAYVGWALVILIAASLAYAWFGDIIPGKYGHSGYGLDRLTSTLLLSTEGFYGVPMGVAAEYIFLFALFGALLTKIGTGEVFVDIARGITGRVRGGPGLSAALSSTLIGSLNGSAVANVVTTGTFTIPLMRRVGYSPKLAGAIEAAASSAGQIMPPVMGAAAFLMAEMIGVPYAQIALAALIPALLYVFALMLAVYLEAGRLGLERDTSGGLKFLAQTLMQRGYLLLPLITLIVLMMQGRSPTQAAVVAIIFGLLISPWHKLTRVGPIDLIEVCKDTLKATLPIVAAVAAAGTVIGVLNLTGMGLMVSSLIVEVGGQSLWAVLLLTALASFILGMGLPTSAAYLLLAVLVAPALTRLGMPPISAHMFIFYFGLVSAITPPVALAAYAAASIAGAPANATAIESMRLGFVKLLVPFLFVYMPGLLLIGDAIDVLMAITLAFPAALGITVGFAGWLVRPLPAVERAVLILASLLVAWPAPAASFEVGIIVIRVAGALAMAAILLRIFLRPVADPCNVPKVGKAKAESP